MISSDFTRILTKLTGTVCIGCERTHFGDAPWCDRCAEALPWWDAGQACVRCGEALASGGGETAGVCTRCAASPPSFQSTQAAFWYRAPVDRWVHRLKFHRALPYATALGTHLPPPPNHGAICCCRFRLLQNGNERAGSIRRRRSRGRLRVSGAFLGRRTGCGGAKKRRCRRPLIARTVWKTSRRRSSCAIAAW